MLTFHHRPVSIAVLMAVALHLFWAIMLVFDRAPLKVNAINALARFVDPPGLIVFLLALAAMLALFGVLYRLPWWTLVPADYSTCFRIPRTRSSTLRWSGRRASG
jgi:hypothetical protein